MLHRRINVIHLHKGRQLNVLMYARMIHKGRQLDLHQFRLYTFR